MTLERFRSYEWRKHLVTKYEISEDDEEELRLRTARSVVISALLSLIVGYFVGAL